jgi:hypothetical protein
MKKKGWVLGLFFHLGSSSLKYLFSVEKVGPCFPEPHSVFVEKKRTQQKRGAKYHAK